MNFYKKNYLNLFPIQQQKTWSLAYTIQLAIVTTSEGPIL